MADRRSQSQMQKYLCFKVNIVVLQTNICLNRECHRRISLCRIPNAKGYTTPLLASVHNFCDTRKPQGNTFETGMVNKVPSLAVDRAGREVLGNERLRHTAARKPPTVPPTDALAVQVYNARKEAL